MNDTREVTHDPARTGDTPVVLRYAPPDATASPAKYLVTKAGDGMPEQRHVFFDRLEIGRDEDGRETTPGLLLLREPSVSWSHCIVTQHGDGRCFVRDVSRNGTSIDGRRVVPNVETEVRAGQVLRVGAAVEFVLVGETPAVQPMRTPATKGRTTAAPQLFIATVLVGDIRGYTTLVRTAPPTALQRSVRRVFEVLTATVADSGGTVKEFQGDAIFAYWEGNSGGGHAVCACRAAVELDRTARRIAADASIWELQDAPLRMDWALATGPVVMDSIGGDRPVGLSLVGEPVVLAFRLEKLASAETGSIVVCRETYRRAARAFSFRDLGERQVAGFDTPDHVFALVVPNG